MIGPEFRVLDDGRLSVRGPRPKSWPYPCDIASANGLMIDSVGAVYEAQPWCELLSGSASQALPSTSAGDSSIPGYTLKVTNALQSPAAVSGWASLTLDLVAAQSGEKIPPAAKNSAFRASLSAGATQVAEDGFNLSLPDSDGVFRRASIQLTYPFTGQIPAAGASGAGEWSVTLSGLYTLGAAVGRASSCTWTISGVAFTGTQKGM